MEHTTHQHTQHLIIQGTEKRVPQYPQAPQEWHTQVALPFVKIVGTTVEWDEIRFDVRLLQRVPYEGISRMSTSLRRRHRDRVVRRGSTCCTQRSHCQRQSLCTL